ncbi:MAG: GDSL-type esterase/lipase family protein [Clostridiales bacterium]|nr:GDSL-type esterase/lipase family protein [Clostridiales bacterium]
MEKWKKILQNCPYISALLIIWIFMTAGSIGLMIYRDYGGPEKSKFLSNPLFAIIMEEEMHGMTENAVVHAQLLPVAIPENDGADNLFINVKQKASESIAEGIKNNVGYTDIEGRDIDEEQAAGEETDTPDDTGEAAEVKAGRTVFVPYTPVETNSVYYSDAGQYALTTEYDYTTVDDEYFNDAAFIGDSRTLGIADYSGIDADFYCESGMTIYKLFNEKGVKNPKTGEKVNLNEVLQNKEYGKIYIMLGLNELGYGNTGKFYEKYSEVVAQIREWQPQAVIFVMANLHVSQEKNNYDTEFNNINVNDKNAAIANLADGLNVFYIDCNPLFVDEGGFLKADLTFDGVHLYAKSYSVWKEFLLEHGVVRDGE